MNRFHLYYSFISFLLYLSSCFVFFFGYGVIRGGIWASFAALTAGFCCILHVLYMTGVLHQRFTSKILDYLSVLGFTICLVGCTFTLWYIFGMVYWKTFSDLFLAQISSCVFSAITGKWGFHFHSACEQYSKTLSSAYSPLLQTI